MKVRMITVSCGPEGTHNPGDVIDVSPQLAEKLVQGGYASYVGPLVPVSTVEVATTEAPEDASVEHVMPRKRGRPRGSV